MVERAFCVRWTLGLGCSLTWLLLTRSQTEILLKLEAPLLCLHSLYGRSSVDASRQATYLIEKDEKPSYSWLALCSETPLYRAVRAVDYLQL